MNTYQKCREYDIHYCCFKCKFSCKKPFADWSRNVPCYEFCQYYEEPEYPEQAKIKRWLKLHEKR